jgi:hypothetical protein
MQNAAAAGWPVLTEGQTTTVSVVADLTSLIGHVRASIAPVETAMAREFSEREPGSGRRHLHAG